MTAYHYLVTDATDDNYEYLCESDTELNDLIADIMEHSPAFGEVVLTIQLIPVESEEAS